MGELVRPVQGLSSWQDLPGVTRMLPQGNDFAPFWPKVNATRLSAGRLVIGFTRGIAAGFAEQATGRLQTSDFSNQVQGLEREA